MKSKRTQLFLLAFYVVLLVLIGLFQPKEVDWTPTFSSADKIPYGNYILYNELKGLFPKSEIYENQVPFYNFSEEEDSGSSGNNFIAVNTEMTADKLDVQYMTEFVSNGNNIFISTTSIPAGLEDSLGIRITKSLNLENFSLDQKKDGKYKANFTNTHLKNDTGYSFKRDYISYQVVDADSAAKHLSTLDLQKRHANHLPWFTLGTDGEGKTNFAKIPFGKGSFYIHTFPFAFTNYHLLKGNDQEYIAKCLSYLPNETIYWDEYYKPFKQQKADTPLRFILSVPAYKWAYYVAILSLLIYILFSIKREQRIIPIIEPFKNLSLEFARTVGTLFYQQSDHKNLAEKKMLYFLEKIRNAYLLSTNITDEHFQAKLSYKSNVSIQTIEPVFRIYHTYIRSGRHVNEETLIAFNAAIEKFYNESGLANK